MRGGRERESRVTQPDEAPAVGSARSEPPWVSGHGRGRHSNAPVEKRPVLSTTNTLLHRSIRGHAVRRTTKATRGPTTARSIHFPPPAHPRGISQIHDRKPSWRHACCRERATRSRRGRCSGRGSSSRWPPTEYTSQPNRGGHRVCTHHSPCPRTGKKNSGRHARAPRSSLQHPQGLAQRTLRPPSAPSTNLTSECLGREGGPGGTALELLQLLAAAGAR